VGGGVGGRGGRGIIEQRICGQFLNKAKVWRDLNYNLPPATVIIRDVTVIIAAYTVYVHTYL